jgi:hypothetical protein
LVGIASGLSIILGVGVAATQLVRFVSETERANVGLRLSSLSHLSQVLAKDEEIRRRSHVFLKERLPKLVPRVDQLIEEHGNGEAFYLSEEMLDFAAVHWHYEQLGALVKLKYLEFSLIFEVIPFPDLYWEQTEPLRASIKRNWRGKGAELPDFGANFEFLRECYLLSRRHPKQISCPSP